MTITNINYGNPVGGSQSWLIEHKLWSDPVTSYIVDDAAAIADVSGNLSSPLVVSGLTAGEQYHFRVSNNCGSPRVYYQQLIQV